MKKLILSVFTLSALSLYSCKKDDINVAANKSGAPSSTMQTMSGNSNGNTDLYRKFAKSFSITANNAEVRNFVLTEVLKQANGDYEVLYMLIKNHVFSDQQTFEQKIITSSSGTLTASMMNNDKLLSICLPVHATTVTSSVVPSVVYGDDEDAQTIYGFNPQQQAISVNNRTTPNEAYWVIRDNERYTQSGTLKQGISDMLSVLGDARVGREFGPTNSRRRNENPLVNEIFKSYEIPDLGAIESWARGKPEIKVYVVGNKDNVGIDIQYFYLASMPRRDYGEGKVISDRREICIWTTSNYGNSLQYKFYESDGGNDYPENFGLKNLFAGGTDFPFTSANGGWHPIDEPMGWNDVKITDAYTILTAGSELGAPVRIKYLCSDY